MSRVLQYFNIENRVYYHFLFWFSYYLYRVMIYGDIKNTYENVAYVQALEIILKIVAVYFTLYYLKPRYFDTKKYFRFSLFLLITVVVLSYLQLHVIWLCVNLGIWGETAYEVVFSKWRFRSSLGHINWIVTVTFVIKLAKERYENVQINAQLVKEKLEAELQFLKSQINPHFFFNTLNNLYSLTQKKSDQAPDVVLKLSELMSYIIYDTTNETVEFKKELNFIENYIELEKLRYGAYLKVGVKVDDELQEVRIPPLLFIPFVENSFKHGAAMGGSDNEIHIVFEMNKGVLKFTVRNKIDQIRKSPKNRKGGVGLKNIKRRLELLYPDKHKLNFTQGENEFNVDLEIELKGLVKLNDEN